MRRKRLGHDKNDERTIAHPDFREQLIQDAEKMGIWRRSNK